MAISETAGPVGGDESVSQTVVHAVARLTDSEPESLEPLYHTIDSEALNDLFGGNRGTSRQSPDRVTFTYCGCDVVVTAPGEVRVSKAEQETSE